MIAAISMDHKRNNHMPSSNTRGPLRVWNCRAAPGSGFVR